MTIKKQHTEKMPEDLQRKVEQLDTMHRKYAEYRSRGLTKADAAQKAGSMAKDRKGLSRVGYNFEYKYPAITEYINWLIQVRAKTAMVDSIEIVDKLRRIYDESMDDGKYSDAVKAATSLGDMIGVFDKNRAANPKGVGEDLRKQEVTIKNDVDAFKEEGETEEERVRKISNLIKEVGKLK